MSKFLQDDDNDKDKAIAKPQVFSENNQGKNKGVKLNYKNGPPSK